MNKIALEYTDTAELYIFYYLKKQLNSEISAFNKTNT